VKDFFPLALRKHFQLSLHEMQKDLDAFVDAYNSMQMKRMAAGKTRLPSNEFPC
jgi:hypothetical protein